MSTEEKLHIRDGRKRNRYSIDHAIFNRKPNQKYCWAALIKSNGMAIYNAIVHHADYNSQDCYPSFSTLANETGMSLSQAKREVKKLAEFQFISITPGDSRSSNTYFLTDCSEWTIPKSYSVPKTRSDKGKPNPKRARKSTASSVSETPEVVSGRHQEGSVSETPEVVSDRHQGNVSKTPKVVSDRHPNNNHINNSQLTFPNTNSKQSESTSSNLTHTNTDKSQITAEAAAAEINKIFFVDGRKEEITKGNLKKIQKVHRLHSCEEITKAVRALASKKFSFAGKRIENVIGFLIGKKTDEGEFHSNCFFDGECIFPEPQLTTTQPMQTQTITVDWQARFDALPTEQQNTYCESAEKRIRNYKNKMTAEVYLETIRTSSLRAFCDDSLAEVAGK